MISFQKGDCIKPNGGSYRNEYLILNTTSSGYSTRNLYSGRVSSLPRKFVDEHCYITGKMAVFTPAQKYKGRKGE